MIQHLNLRLCYSLYNSTETNLEVKDQKSCLSKGTQHQQLMEAAGMQDACWILFSPPRIVHPPCPVTDLPTLCVLISQP